MGVKEFGELLSIKNVVGAKYGSTDIFLFERLLRTYPDKLFLFAFDEAIAPALTLGTKSFIGSTYNINTKGARTIIDAFEKGDKELVQKSVHKYNDYASKLVDMGVMAGIKAVFEVEGIIHGTTRKPFYQYDRSTLLEKAKELQKIIKQ
nr:dihydrodipicolinate synthase family protein [Mesomycoplasma hyorhinis]